MPVIEPGGQIRSALIEREGLIVGEVVGVAHKGVDGTDGIALVSGQRDEGVVEILSFFPSNFATYPVGFVHRRRCRGGWRRGHAAFPFVPAVLFARPLPRNLPVRARRSSAALR